MTLESPVSAVEYDSVCPSLSCGFQSDAREPGLRAELASFNGIFRVCKQLRLEALNAFNRVNSWNLEHAVFDQMEDLTIPISYRRPIHNLQHLTKDNKHFFLRLDVSPSGVYELSGGLPADIDRTSTYAVRKWLLSEQMEGNLQRLPIITEREMCDGYVKMLKNFATAQASGSNCPRSLKLQVVIHEPRWLRRPSDQCGLTLHLNIRFRAPEVTQSPLQAVSPPTLSSLNLEQKRRLLMPLLDLQNIHSIDVRRRWTLKVLKEDPVRIGNGLPEPAVTTQIQVIAMALHFQYGTARELFLAAGEDFVNFRRTGLAEAGVHADKLLAIDENTPSAENAVLLAQKTTEGSNYCFDILK